MKTKNNCMYWAVTAIALFFISCEKVDNPYLPFKPVVPTNDTIRKILVEDYTGHKCPNCPSAAEQLHSLESKIFPKQIIGLAVHTGGFSPPEPGYRQDFRTKIGNTYASDYGISLFPMGVINRKKINNQFGVDHDEWKKVIDTLANQKPSIYIEIKNSYDEVTRKLNTEVKSTFLKSLTGTYNLVVLFSEDSVIAPQLDGSNKIDKYVHMHMLRDGISDATGAGIQLVSGSVAAKQTITQSFTYTVPNGFDFILTDTYPATVPVIKNCNVVAFIYNQITKEVLQAEKGKIK
jgi:thiol-disulfide isomerase/thioredoxin